MKFKLNLFSFILSLICLASFFLVILSRNVSNFIFNLLQLHPLYIVILLCIITLILGLIGFSEATNGMSLLMGILTVMITIILLGVVIYILVLGNLFKFT